MASGSSNLKQAEATLLRVCAGTGEFIPPHHIKVRHCFDLSEWPFRHHFLPPGIAIAPSPKYFANQKNKEFKNNDI